MVPDERPHSEDPEGHRFLNQGRVENIAELIAPLLEKDLSWIERRKDSVTVLDDTALRRQISVDFSLRRTTSPLLEARLEDGLEALYCAPVFVLPKASGNLMAFDLEDEDGHSLTLTSRVDNARISGAALVRMAMDCLGALGRVLPDDLEDQLRELAQSEPAHAKLVADRLRLGRRTSFSDELALLRSDPRFCWWLSTFAHSSVVVVLFRSAGPRRKMAKLSF